MKKLLISLITLFFASSAYAEPVVNTQNLIKGINKADTKKEFVIATVVKVDGIARFDRMRDGVEHASGNASGAYLDPSVVAEARAVEMKLFNDMSVYDRVDRQDDSQRGGHYKISMHRR